MPLTKHALREPKQKAPVVLLDELERDHICDTPR
jgi:hypothetical protein